MASVLHLHAYPADGELTFHLVHCVHERFSHAQRPHARVHKGRYECLVKDDVAFWINKKVELSNRDITGVKIMVIELDVSSLKPRQREFYPDLEGGFSANTDPTNRGYAARILFNSNGWTKLTYLCKNNIGKRLAIVLDGKLILAPVIKEQIVGGEMEVAGLSFDEAKRLKEIISRSSQ